MVQGFCKLTLKLLNFLMDFVLIPFHYILEKDQIYEIWSLYHQFEKFYAYLPDYMVQLIHMHKVDYINNNFVHEESKSEIEFKLISVIYFSYLSTEQ